MAITVTDDQVTEYDALVNKLARKYEGYGNAELDDLIQEGRISVWQALQRGNVPSKEVIEYRMLSWVRFLRRLAHNDALSYFLLLPMEADV